MTAPMDPAQMLASALLPQAEGVRDLIPHRFVQAWLKNAARLAIIDGARDDARFDYKTLGLGAHLFATWLQNNTDTRKQNYGILLPAGLAFSTAMYAIHLLGKTAVPLNYALSPKELVDIAKDADLTTLITFDPDPNDRANMAIFGQTTEVLNDEILNLLPVLINHHHVQGTIRQGPPLTQLPQITPDDTAILLYTSGSTGKPKGVMMTHRNLTSNADACADALGEESDQVMLGILPAFHTFALTATILYPTFTGMATYFEPRFAPRTLLEKIPKHGVTIVLGVPSMYKAYIAAARMRPSEAFAGVKVFVSGGAPLPLELASVFEKIFGKPIHEGYGTTETSPVISLNPLNEAPHYGTVGTPVTGVKVEVRDSTGVKVPAGVPGELWVSGPGVTKGYCNKPEETAKVFQNGWYNTQDMVALDEQGFIRILGRTKHMIIVGGENVYPAEVENAVLQVPQVKEVAVTGTPDEKRGENVLAFIVAAEEWAGTAEDMEALIREFISGKESLAAYKIPHEVRLVPMIPLLPSGKPDLPALKGERAPVTNVAVAQAQQALLKAELEGAAAGKG